MQTQPLTRVLLLANDFESAHGLREAALRVGLPVDINQVATREEFLGNIRKSRPTLAVANLGGVQTLPLLGALEGAREADPPVPVVVIGNEAVDSPEALAAIRRGAADYLLASDLQRLPIIVERLARERATAGEVRAAVEPQRTSQVLRENQKLITIGRLAGSIAHEINNPLESITNLLYLLEAIPGMPEAANKYLTLAQRELDRVVQITKQTLNFYRETPVAVRLQPSELIEEVLVLYGRRIEEKQLQIIREYDSQETVSVFPGEMRQVFSNLITNAIEASSQGGKLRLRVRNARQWSDSGILGLRVSVGDSGSGIPASVRGRLGEPFFTTKGQRGTGLGLWVTQTILERYGGHLQLCSST
ncbi:MAG TPA: ATP-binding protein, partial [Acidisarcina sp.]